MRVAVVACVVVTMGCGPVVAMSGTTGGGESTGPANASVGDGPSPTTVGSTTVDSTTVGSTTAVTTSASESSSGGSSEDGSADDQPFIVEGDMGGPAIECDVWAQDCPPGEKCMPWSNDGSSSWNATRCSPIADEPGSAGDPCTVEGSAVSGIDDCELGAMCWDVDSKTNTGECVAFCMGSEANPTCADPCSTCTINSGGELILCLPGCDPLAQDCPRGEACYLDYGYFACVPDAGGDMGAVGEPCAFINVCDPGLYCAPAETVPGCEDEGCCAPFCDVAQPDTCDAILPGTACVPLFERMRPSECFIGIVGACMLPR